MGVLGHSLVRLLALLTRSLAPHYSLRSLTLLTPELVGQCLIKWLFILCFPYSGP